MALIICMECGKSISDKADACIGCGCPVELSINNNQEQSDWSKLSKEDLWFKAYNIQYKSDKISLPVAVEIYHNLVEHYSNSAEAGYAKAQLLILGIETPKPNIINDKNTKLCPFCAEKILDTAKKCKHCYSMLDGSVGSDVNFDAKHSCKYCSRLIHISVEKCAECIHKD